MEQKVKSFTTHERYGVTISEVDPKGYHLSISYAGCPGCPSCVLRLTRSDLENLVAILKEELDNTTV